MTTQEIVQSTKTQGPVRLRWMPFLTRAVFIRSAVVALIIGVALTLTNQSGAVFGSDTFDILPLFMVFVTPFSVITISQATAVRRASLDAMKLRLPAERSRFLATALANGIPERAISVGLIVGTVNTAIILTETAIRTGGLATAPAALIGQAYVLPILFGVLSQTVSYRRAAVQMARQQD